LVGVYRPSWWSDAQLHVYSAQGDIVPLYAQTIAKNARDVMLADLDADRRAELVILHEGRTIELFEAGEGTTIVSPVLTHVLQVGVDPDRIGASDFDGDSPRTRLMNDEGVLLPGPVVPLAVAHFPPYDAERSRERPAIVLGNSENKSESFSDTISLRSTIDVGVSAGLFGLFKFELGARVQSEVKQTMTTSTSFDIGRRIIASPDPELAGFDYAIVALACACYHAYHYEVHDPGGRLGAGADGEQFVMVLPVGGTATAWSSKRYNAMAEAVGNLPIVAVPYAIGNPSSYSSGPQRADGSPIPADDFVFPEVPSLLVSDVAKVGWWLSVGESETNTVATSSMMEISGELGLGGFKFGTALGHGWGRSHSIKVGESALFGGTVPPIVDDPSTPEDEYLEYAFAFSPYVYREHWTDANGNDASYYVMSFAVAR
jgi:hypothetical protein